jgi:hypothetical protein
VKPNGRKGVPEQGREAARFLAAPKGGSLDRFLATGFVQAVNSGDRR